MSGETPDSGEGHVPTSPHTTVQPATGVTNDCAPHASGHVHARQPAIQFRFLEQLKHRNIIRVGILYLVACWLVLDPVHVVFHMLEVPIWANRLVVILMAIGFPAVLLFAWVYEITPDGLKPTMDVDPHPSIRRRTGQRLDRAIMGLLVLGIAYLLVDKVWLSKQVTTEQAATPAALRSAPAATAISDKSVAVLPFVNMSEDKNNEYFSDGLSEELIDMLTKIPDLRVPARTSSFYFKGKQVTVPDIAKALSVAHVLEGSVRKSGNHLRITAQLVRADNGYHLWSETYDRQLDDIFKIQDEIAGAVVTALKMSLLEGGVPRTAPTSNMEAYALYLQARTIATNSAQQGDVKRAIDLVQRALKLDPRFARAWAALARYRAYDYEYFTSGNYQQVFAEARYAAEQALNLDPQLSDAHLAMGQLLFDLDWNWEGAEAEINKALALDPGNANVLQWASAIVRTRGRFVEALQLGQSAIARDPLDAWNYGVVGNAYRASGRLNEAEGAYRQALALAPTMSQLHIMVGWLLVERRELTAALTEMEQETDVRYREIGRALALDALGRKSEANRALAITEMKYAGVVEYPIAVVYANRNDGDKAFAWLDRAYQMHDGWVPWVAWDPSLKNLRGDSRYRAFLQKIDLQ